MKAFHIGQIIKDRRIQLGLTQEELCEGICEPPTLSRIESGRNDPSRSKLTALLQRLGLPENRFFALLSEKDIQISNLQTEIVSLNVHRDSQKALEKLTQLEQIVRKDNIIQQFILRSKVLIGIPDGDSFQPYDFQTKLDILSEAMHLTIPNFQLDNIGQHLYSMDEVKIINQIAVTYAEHGHRRKAIDIYYHLLKYLQRGLQDLEQTANLSSLISYNYSHILREENRLEESLEIALWGWQHCVRYCKTEWLGGILAIMADCYYRLGQSEKGIQHFRESYYIYCAMQNFQDAEEIKNYLKKISDMDIV